MMVGVTRSAYAPKRSGAQARPPDLGAPAYRQAGAEGLPYV